MKGIAVAGTDTGAGKTYASVALIKGWRKRSLSVGVMKPCETGCGPEGPQDAQMLLEASGSGQSIDEVCPFRFLLPMAPSEAAAVEGGGVSFEKIAEIHRAIASRYDVTLVEGAGGLLVPFAEEKTFADLVKLLGLPVVVVARSGLGTINHACLTIEAARSRGLDVLGVIFTRCLDPREHPPGPDEPRNPSAVARLARVRVLAELPYEPEEVPEIDLLL